MNGRDSMETAEGRARLLRRAADGELDEIERASLSAWLASHPEDRARIDFEAGLRDRCREVMGGVRVPESLRKRIGGLIAASVPVEEVEPEPPTVLARLATPLMGVAAAIAVVAAVVVAVTSSVGGSGSGAPSATASWAVRVASFMEQEHERCATDSVELNSKLGLKDLSKLPEATLAWIGAALSLEGLAAPGSGLRFVGAGECGVPGKGRSAHLRFETDGTVGEAGMSVSVFLQRYMGEPRLEEGTAYTMSPIEGAEAEARTFVMWRRGAVVYYVVTDAPAARRCAGAALGVPERSGGCLSRKR